MFFCLSLESSFVLCRQIEVVVVVVSFVTSHNSQHLPEESSNCALLLSSLIKLKTLINTLARNFLKPIIIWRL